MRRKSSQQGVALIESAFTLSIFLIVVIAIIEVSMLMFAWARGAEAARVANRMAVVRAPLIDLSALNCNGGSASELSTTCSGVDQCDEIYETAAGFLPQLTKSQLVVSYRCSTAGFSGRPVELFIPEVTVQLVDVPYRMVLPGIVGLPRDWILPDMVSTRTGEALETITGP